MRPAVNSNTRRDFIKTAVMGVAGHVDLHLPEDLLTTYDKRVPFFRR